MPSLRQPSAVAPATALAAVAALAACSPALDWREVRAAGGVQGLMPCRPDRHERSVALAGGRVKLALAACSAGGRTWALASADVVDPARVGAALDELRRAAAANIGAGEGRPVALNVPGATPFAQAARVALAGRLPDGRDVAEQVAVFARGTTVVQATVVGATAAAGDEAVETFFGALRFEAAR